MEKILINFRYKLNVIVFLEILGIFWRTKNFFSIFVFLVFLDKKFTSDFCYEFIDFNVYFCPPTFFLISDISKISLISRQTLSTLSLLSIDVNCSKIKIGKRTDARKKWHITPILILGQFTPIPLLFNTLPPFPPKFLAPFMGFLSVYLILIDNCIL